MNIYVRTGNSNEEVIKNNLYIETIEPEHPPDVLYIGVRFFIGLKKEYSISDFEQVTLRF